MLRVSEKSKCDFSKMNTFSKDPHSYATPESAYVTHIQFKLNVNFSKLILNGKVILTIKTKLEDNLDKNNSENNLNGITEVILDTYDLDILDVKNFITGSHLKYHVGCQTLFGRALTIQLPHTVEAKNSNEYKIEIEYKTNRKSPSLYWLTPQQTADCIHPFLLSYNKLTFARSMFPCQDTPSVKFTYSAKISVDKDYTVLMSANLKKKFKNKNLYVYEFEQTNPIPSYAVVIAVGSLQKIKISSKYSVYAEKKYIGKSLKIFDEIKKMLRIAEELCGPYRWSTYNMCVLPPFASHFEIECPCLVFISPTLLDGDCSLISSIGWNIAHNWAGNLVTCENYNEFWLNESFSLFIYRKIVNKMSIHPSMKQYLERKGIKELNQKSGKCRPTDSVKTLIPNLRGLLPFHVIKSVPYEVGYWLLVHLEQLLGGSSVFEPFLESYFNNFAFKSINTRKWLNYLYYCFSEKREVLECNDWNIWFFNTKCIKLPNINLTPLEVECQELTNEWVKWDIHDNERTLKFFSIHLDIQKVLFLMYLQQQSSILLVSKMEKMLQCYNFDTENGEIRFHWMRLCIKYQWEEKFEAIFDFINEFCSPKHTRVIFTELLHWPLAQLKAQQVLFHCVCLNTAKGSFKCDYSEWNHYYYQYYRNIV